jgi:hypothetical protein
MTPILGFAPDADQTTAGILSDCANLIPALVGMAGGPSTVTPGGVPVLPGVCQGAAVVSKLDDSRRVMAGTQTKIFELVAGTWTDRTRVGDYTSGPESQWSITQFGDATLMANRADAMQRSTTGVFSNIATAPRAEIVFSVGSQVMALNVNDGAEKSDGWHCCAVFDDTSWEPSVATQATSGRLVATAGAIKAGARLGEYAVAYKERSIYLGQYVGAPVVWDWVQIAAGEAGCVGKNAICDVGGAHFFVGPDNFWLFDGTRPAPLGDGVLREWFLENSSAEFKYKTECTFDRERNLVWVFYPGKNSSVLNSALVYHIQSKKWGRANRSIQTALVYVSSGVTIDGLSAFSATIDGLPNVGFDSPFWISGSRSFAVFNTANQLQSLTGLSVSSSMTTGEVGDDDGVSLLQQIRVRYKLAPASATVRTSSAKNSGLPFVDGPSGALNDGKFDVLKSARWHKARVDFTGPVQVTHLNAKFTTAGKR